MGLRPGHCNPLCIFDGVGAYCSPAIWPYFRDRGYEATFIALFFAVFAWIVMHVAIVIASNNHPNYYDPAVVIGGIMSHFCFTVPLALTVKRLLSRQPVH